MNKQASIVKYTRSSYAVQRTATKFVSRDLSMSV